MFRYILATCIFLSGVLSLNGQQPFTCKGQYFLSLTRQGDNFSGLYEVLVDPVTKKVRLDTISSNIGLILNGMGFRSQDQFIYGLDPARGRLRKVGRDGMAVDLGVPAGMPKGDLFFAGDITPDGHYLITVGIGSASGKLIRIDLTDPTYVCSFIPLSDPNVRLVDLAFDPYSGLLYAHDITTSRVVTIDPSTGMVSKNFLPQPNIDQLGALFFDVDGNLYGYGSYLTTVQDKFVSINKQTGEIVLLAQGPVSTGQDGCSCPYTVEMQKTAVPDSMYACTETDFLFRIFNGSGTVLKQVVLEDTLPEGFVWKTIVEAPPTGQVGFSGRFLRIDNLTLQPGENRLIFRCHQTVAKQGLYYNQAFLHQLPPVVGRSILSDYPLSGTQPDSTPVWVLSLPENLFEKEIILCAGDSVYLSSRLFGAEAVWNDGTTKSGRWVVAPDTAALTLRTQCLTKKYEVYVRGDLLYIDIAKDTLDVLLGEQIYLAPDTYWPAKGTSFKWTTNSLGEISCSTCLTSQYTPKSSGYAYIYMYGEDGCEVTDSVYIRVRKDRRLYAPNIIAPASISGNHIFLLQINSPSMQLDWLHIYDRWGNLVFEQVGVFSGEAGKWDGKIKGKSAEEGVYVWVAGISYLDGETEVRSGNVTVIY